MSKKLSITAGDSSTNYASVPGDERHGNSQQQNSALTSQSSGPCDVKLLLIALAAVTALVVSILAVTKSHAGNNNAQQSIVWMDASLYAKKSVMMIAAHPDDVAGANGAFVAALTAAGANVSVLILTNGNAGCSDNISMAMCAAVRRGEEIACDGILGVPAGQVSVLSFFDNHLWDDTYPTFEVMAAIVRGLRQVRPDVVFTFYPDPMWRLKPSLGYDDMGFHPDHQRTGFLVSSAVSGFASSDSRIYNRSYGEPWQPSEMWYWQFGKPTHCYRLTPEELALKIRAFEEHRSQYTDPLEVADWIKEFSILVGSNCGGIGIGIPAEGFERYL